MEAGTITDLAVKKNPAETIKFIGGESMSLENSNNSSSSSSGKGSDVPGY